MNGIPRALDQDSHAAVNARYPGCTLEHCCKCGEATGAAGPGDGSIYAEDGSGPYCATCDPEAHDGAQEGTVPRG